MSAGGDRHAVGGVVAIMLSSRAVPPIVLSSTWSILKPEPPLVWAPVASVPSGSSGTVAALVAERGWRSRWESLRS